MNASQIIIDCDADPFVPDGWKVLSHKKDGQVVWDTEKVGFYIPPCQKDILPPVACEVEEELKDQPVLNANVLDYLIDHPECAGIENLAWMDEGEIKGEIYFWGTIYEDEDGERCVRALTLDDGDLGWGYVRIKHDGLMGEFAPAAIHADEEA